MVQHLELVVMAQRAEEREQFLALRIAAVGDSLPVEAVAFSREMQLSSV